MKILIDMNLSPDWCRWLADRGIQAVHFVLSRRAAESEFFPFAKHELARKLSRRVSAERAHTKQHGIVEKSGTWNLESRISHFAFRIAHPASSKTAAHRFKAFQLLL